MNDYAKIISNNISRLRKENGYTQDAIAEKLNISFQAVSKWENEQSSPDIVLLPTIADIFGITIDELFGRTSSKLVETDKTENQTDSLSQQWKDDDTLRGVVFRGNKILSEKELCNESGNLNFLFELKGEALNVISYCNIKCDTINGVASANCDINCGNIIGDCNAGCNVSAGNVSGNVNACGDVECENVGETVHANGDVHCGDVSGDITTEGNVECGIVSGSVETEGDVYCGDVSGDVKTEGNVGCGIVSGSVETEGDIQCNSVGGSAKAEGNIKCNSVGGDVFCNGELQCNTINGNVVRNNIN